jgi:hypothetical protein
MDRGTGGQPHGPARLHRARALPRAHVVQGHRRLRHRRPEGRGPARGARARALRRAAQGPGRRGAQEDPHRDRRGDPGHGRLCGAQRAQPHVRRDGDRGRQRVHQPRADRLHRRRAQQPAGRVGHGGGRALRRPGVPAVLPRARGGLRGEEPLARQPQPSRERGAHGCALPRAPLRHPDHHRRGRAPQEPRLRRHGGVLRALVRAQQHGGGARGRHRPEDRAAGARGHARQAPAPADLRAARGRAAGLVGAGGPRGAGGGRGGAHARVARRAVGPRGRGRARGDGPRARRRAGGAAQRAARADPEGALGRLVPEHDARGGLDVAARRSARRPDPRGARGDAARGGEGGARRRLHRGGRSSSSPARAWSR